MSVFDPFFIGGEFLEALSPLTTVVLFLICPLIVGLVCFFKKKGILSRWRFRRSALLRGDAALAHYRVCQKSFFSRLFSGDRPVLKIGILPREHIRAYSFLSKAQEGFANDILKSLGHVVRRQIVLIEVSASEIEAQLHDGTIDCAMLDSRSESLLMSENLTAIACYSNSISSLSMLYWEKALQQVTSLDEYEFYGVNSTAVIRNTFAEHYLSLHTDIEMRRVANIDQMVAEIKLGTVRAGLLRFEDGFWAKNNYSNMKIIPISISPSSIVQDEYLCCSNSNQETVQMVSQAIRALERLGVLDEHYRQWFGANN